MKPSTDRCLAHGRKVSTNSADVQTQTIPAGTSHITLSVETSDARVTFDGSDPSAVGAPSHVYPAGVAPIFLPLGQGSTIKHCCATGANSVLQIGFHL